jgi:hypothetical protein
LKKSTPNCKEGRWGNTVAGPKRDMIIDIVIKEVVVVLATIIENVFVSDDPLLGILQAGMRVEVKEVVAVISPFLH